MKVAKNKGDDYGGVLYIRGIPTDLKDRFKAYCARRGHNMTAVIHTMIAEVLAAEERAQRNQRVY